MSAEHQGKGGENPRVLLSRTIASCALLLLVAGTSSDAAVVFSAAEDFSLLLDEVVALDEDVGQYLVCAENYTETGTTTVAVQYHSISAVADEDFVSMPVNFTFSSNKNATLSQACFNISIINDDKYETEEMFQVNFTTNPSLLITPTHLTVIIIDEDGLEVAWETMVYTVQEGDEEVELCLRLTGTYAGLPPGPEFSIELMANTAQQGRDYLPPSSEGLHFEGNASIQCESIGIIANIGFGGSREFMASIILRSNSFERIGIGPAARILILDRNVIDEQQPGSVCAGLQNFLNVSLPVNASCMAVQDCTRVECEGPLEAFSVSLVPCRNGTVQVEISTIDQSITLLNVSLHSMTQVQRLDYTALQPRRRQSLALWVEVVLENGNKYYILSVQSSNGIELPMAAIPLICVGSVNRLIHGYISAAAAVGSTILLMTITFLILYFLSKSNRIRQKM